MALWSGSTTGDIWNLNSGNVLITGDTCLAIGTSVANISILTLSSNSNPILYHSMYSDTAGTCPNYRFSRARGTMASPTKLSSGDALGRITFYGAYNAAGVGTFASGAQARINCVAEEEFINSTHLGTNLQFSTTSLSSSTLTERMRISANGWVGIGTTGLSGGVPESPFHVVGGTQNTVMILDNVGNPGKLVGRRWNTSISSPTALLAKNSICTLNARGYDGTSMMTTDASSLVMAAEENWSSTAHGTYIGFWTTLATTTTNAEKMRLTSGGKLGIGTTTPDAPLHVGVNGAALRIGDNTNTNSYMQISSDGTNNRAQIGYYNSYLMLQGGATKGVQIAVNNNTFGSGVVATFSTSGYLGLGTASSIDSRLTFAASTTAAGGLLFGTDTNLYRSAADTLKTDDKLITGDDIETYGDLRLNNGSDRVIILTGAASASNKTITFPNLTGNVILDTSTFNRYSLQFNAAVLSTVNVSTNYYFGSQFTLAPSTTRGVRRNYIPHAGTIKACYVYATFTNGISTHSGTTFTISINDSTSVGIGQNTTTFTTPVIVSNTSLNTAVNAGDYLEIYMTTSDYWTNKPTNIYLNAVVYIE